MTEEAPRPAEAAGDPPVQPEMDELIMAMDAVDTLRHEDALVLRELGQGERDAALKRRLRELYESQGLVVTDQILDEGIKSLREDRFAYHPEGSWFSRGLARIWIKRAKYGSILAVIFGITGVGAGGNAYYSYSTAQQAETVRVELQETLPRQLNEQAQKALALAKSADATQEIETLQEVGNAALQREDVAGARDAIGKIRSVAGILGQDYTLRIVSRPGERTGVFREPINNSSAHNYYLIVEAVDRSGRVIPQSIVSEEDNSTKTVTIWGQRVPQSTYNQVARDKTDDGIVQNNVLGRKPLGYLKPEYTMPVQNGAITEW
ncbi:MAG: DUF6384 family protein [Methylobacteriaceae bacterium]|jgi:hypothetical protein|nr:DUF6384 family protein [Methylobacteriaceae bacterium]